MYDREQEEVDLKRVKNFIFNNKMREKQKSFLQVSVWISHEILFIKIIQS
jgi:hypothetical protein